MNAPAPSTPGVRFPPPLMFATGLVAGWALHHGVHPWPLVPAGRGGWIYLHVLAFAVVAAWLIVSALGGFRRRGTDPRPWREDSALVVEGIYLQTRNPMYLGMALAYVAIALVMNTPWPLLTLVPVMAVIRYHVIRREEAYLLRRFGADYAHYCARVRRWF